MALPQQRQSLCCRRPPTSQDHRDRETASGHGLETRSKSAAIKHNAKRHLKPGGWGALGGSTRQSCVLRTSAKCSVVELSVFPILTCRAHHHHFWGRTVNRNPDTCGFWQTMADNSS